VIGAATAYYLARGGAEAVVVERSAPACGASGKSGGFLALDWCDGTPLEALARRSFTLHGTLPEEIDAEWGYRRLSTYSAFGGAGHGAHLGEARGPVRWLSASVGVDRRLGSPETTAQVDPAAFTMGLLSGAEAAGARLVAGRVTGLLGSGEAVRGVELEDGRIEGDAVVIAMGPWSIEASRWLGLPPVFGLKGHSLLFATGEALPPEALFLDYQEADGSRQAPELFPRPDGTTYICAISSEAPLPPDPELVAADPGAFERLEAICRDLSPALVDAPILARQACYRPLTRDGLPMIGAVPDAPGCYIATGHSVWGILNAPATGEALAELILEGRTSTVDLARFAPDRRSLAPA
jgi:glycine/D-amino acid oxidase-like deaminating enzyme